MKHFTVIQVFFDSYTLEEDRVLRIRYADGKLLLCRIAE
mgnify:CR=1 FL=1